MKISTFTLAGAYLRHGWQRTFYNLLTFALGTALIALVLSLGGQLERNLDRNLKGIDMVVGAKGSPLQLVLSAVLQADVPTGNIPLADAKTVAANPMVKEAIPMALGDNVQGYRIVGTTDAYPAHYGATLAAGRMISATAMEAVLGSEVQAKLHLAVGQKFAGSHGLTPGGELHDFAPYTVVGVLKPTGSIVDRLVLTPVGSVWYVHENDPDEPADVRPNANNRAITALLVKFSTPLAIVGLPRQINSQTNMQAAVPAMEAFRLRQIVGMGSDTLALVGGAVVALAALGLLISMAEAVRQRLYDLAILRCLGASPAKVLWLVVLEGLFVSGVGGVLGLGAAYAATKLAAGQLFGGQLAQGGAGDPSQMALLLGGVLGLGLLGSLLPALRVYRLSLPSLLAGR